MLVLNLYALKRAFFIVSNKLYKDSLVNLFSFVYLLMDSMKLTL